MSGQGPNSRRFVHHFCTSQFQYKVYKVLLMVLYLINPFIVARSPPPQNIATLAHPSTQYYIFCPSL